MAQRWKSELDWRLSFLLLLIFLWFLSFSSLTNLFLSPLRQTILRRRRPPHPLPTLVSLPPLPPPSPRPTHLLRQRKAQLDRSRIAICLVGPARRLDLSGPSILENVLKAYPNADLFLHSPLDGGAYKLSVLKEAPSLAAVRIFVPEAEQVRGLLQYFNLAEGCLAMLTAFQTRHNFTFDWVLRARLDAYWSAPLSPATFLPSAYVLPPGSRFGGLNHRLGIGDLPTSVAALSRLPFLRDSSNLTSQQGFLAHLSARGLHHRLAPFPFCILSERAYAFPPPTHGVPVASIASPGPLSGAECRPCTAACVGPCVADVGMSLDERWGWTEWEGGRLELCDARAVAWERGWERIFDEVAGKRATRVRRRVGRMGMEECVVEMEEMRRRAEQWEAPEARAICRAGLGGGRRG